MTTTCSRCGGNGTIECPTCNGEGRLSHIQVVGSQILDCSSCHGLRDIFCPVCNGLGEVMQVVHQSVNQTQKRAQAP